MVDVQLICTRETFRPRPSEGVTWWRAEDWEAARDAHVGMWPGVEWWTREDWQRLYWEGYRYCDLLVNGRAFATAGLWPRTDNEWGVIAVGTGPAYRNRGYGKAIVSFVTQAILDAGRTAVIVTREDNGPMRRVAAALGYEPRKGSWLMKVSDLIAKLQKLDPDLEVLCYTEDKAALPPGHGFALFDIQAVTVTEGEKVRGDDQVPSLKLGSGPQSVKLATLDVTSDF